MKTLACGFAYVVSSLIALSGCSSLAPSLATLQTADPAPQGYVWESIGSGLYKTVPATPDSSLSMDDNKLAAAFEQLRIDQLEMNDPSHLAKAIAVLNTIVAAGNAGNMLAERKLAMAYQYGIVLPRSKPEALSWWQAAAEHGDLGAESMMMRFYMVGGDGVKPDAQKAAYWRQALLRSMPHLKPLLSPEVTTIWQGTSTQ